MTTQSCDDFEMEDLLLPGSQSIKAYGTMR